MIFMGFMIFHSEYRVLIFKFLLGNPFLFATVFFYKPQDLQDASEDQPHQYEYKGELLALCIDLGDRLLPAFRTRTQIPYGTVNLRYGVPFKETKIASTAGAGSLLLEFQILSHLSGDDKYGSAAYNAMKGLYTRKSNIGKILYCHFLFDRFSAVF